MVTSGRRTMLGIRAISLFMTLTVVACAGPSTPTGSDSRSNSSGAAPRPARVVIAVGSDTPHFSTKLDASEAGSFRYDTRFMVNSPLSILDEQGANRPLLAAETPSQEAGTWTVNADGSMATTWKVRPNAVWHNGEPITSNDFVFALRVFQDPDIAVYQRAVETRIDKIDALDDKTFVIHWKQVYLRANRLITGEMEPLPQKAVGALYDEGDKVAFQSSSIWTTPAYVGTGPFRVAEIQPGILTRYQAFDQYFMGRPKADEVVFQVVPDQNAALAQVLAGSIDFTSGQTLNTQSGLAIKQEWSRSGAGRVLENPAVLRQFWVQQRPEVASPAALLDPRVRRAIAHGIDRAGLAAYISGGGSGAADTLVSPTDPMFSRAQQVVSKYPFDRTRALSLLQEAGWSRRGDALVNDQGEQFVTAYWTSIVSDNVTEMEVIAHDLGQLGMDVSQYAPTQAAVTAETTALFPGMSFLTVRNMLIPEGIQEFTTDQCPTPERRYQGNNRGCWSNTELDRLFRAATTNLNEAERIDLTLSALKLLSDELPAVPLSYNIEFIAVRQGLTGPVARPVAQRGYTWNIHEWGWTN